MPVYASTTTQLIGPYETETAQASAEEVHRIWGDFLNRKLGYGTVHVYILRPDGSSMAGLDPIAASNPDKLNLFLTGIIHQLGTTPGAPMIQPRPQSIPPASKHDDLMTHLVARSFNHGYWHEFPSENWIVLTRDEWVQLLPSQVPQEGASWQLAPALTRKLLTHFYPQTEETSDADRSRIDEASLRLTITKVGSGVARARFDGKLRMKHSFYGDKKHEDEQDIVEATLTGFLDFDSAARQIQRMCLITDHATYTGPNFNKSLSVEFGASLNSVSAETLEALLGAQR